MRRRERRRAAGRRDDQLSRGGADDRQRRGTSCRASSAGCGTSRPAGGVPTPAPTAALGELATRGRAVAPTSSRSRPATTAVGADRYPPVLLLPVRLETRFKAVVDGDARAAAVGAHLSRRLLVDTFERSAGRGRARRAPALLDQHVAGRRVEAGERGAWRALATSHGPGRARWIVAAVRAAEPRPTSPPSRPATHILVDRRRPSRSPAPRGQPRRGLLDAVGWQTATADAADGRLRRPRGAPRSARRARPELDRRPCRSTSPTPAAARDRGPRSVAVAFLELPAGRRRQPASCVDATPPTLEAAARPVRAARLHRRHQPALITSGKPIPSAAGGRARPVGPEDEPARATGRRPHGARPRCGGWSTSSAPSTVGMGFRVDLDRRSRPGAASTGCSCSACGSATTPAQARPTSRTLLTHHQPQPRGPRRCCRRARRPTTPSRRRPGYTWCDDADASLRPLLRAGTRPTTRPTGGSGRRPLARRACSASTADVLKRVAGVAAPTSPSAGDEPRAVARDARATSWTR